MLKSEAQELIVLEPTSPAHFGGNSMIPLEVVDTPDEPFHMDEAPMVVDEPVEVELVVEELPGAPDGTHDPEPVLEVEEDPKESKEDDNDAKKSKKPEKWDWAAKGAAGFVAWVKERLEGVPKHSGYDSAGLERAVSYLEKLDNEISKAMRMDLDGELDANKVEEVRSQIDSGISRLHDRLDKVKKSKKTKRKKAEIDPALVKEAQKITGVQGVFVTVPLLISRIARVCINGMVSAGHDIEDMYARQVKKYKLSEREQAEVMQLLSDMGYPMRQDRGYLPDEDIDVASSDNFDWAANYKG
jgi:hypothetical protein